MATLFDYLEGELATFDEKPFGELDTAVLTQASMLEVQGIVPGVDERRPGLLGDLTALVRGPGPVRFCDLIRAERFPGMFCGLVPDDIRRCLFALAASPRFRDLKLSCYRCVQDGATHTQFAAIAFTWRDRFSFIGFRGTDTSLSGWRENLDLSYRDEVGSQGLARRYLEDVMACLPGEIHVGGHSKGGNLALYAALTCNADTCARIRHVWCLDAPGFKHGRFSERDYARVQGRVSRIVPVDSIIGALLECPVEPDAVRSEAQGVDQHNVFSWIVEGNTFSRADGVSDLSRSLHEISGAWLARMDDARKEQVVEAVCAAVAASGVEDVGQILAQGQGAVRGMVEVSRKLDPDTREVLSEAVGDLVDVVVEKLGRDAASVLPWTSGWVQGAQTFQKR